ncbi:MAG: hypothetical protein ACI9G1_002497 [Pirellulaceae bacterium]|jgi:hypothetical protein
MQVRGRPSRRPSRLFDQRNEICCGEHAQPLLASFVVERRNFFYVGQARAIVGRFTMYSRLALNRAVVPGEENARPQFQSGLRV